MYRKECKKKKTSPITGKKQGGKKKKKTFEPCLEGCQRYTLENILR